MLLGRSGHHVDTWPATLNKMKEHDKNVDSK